MVLHMVARSHTLSLTHTLLSPSLRGLIRSLRDDRTPTDPEAKAQREPGHRRRMRGQTGRLPGRVGAGGRCLVVLLERFRSTFSPVQCTSTTRDTSSKPLARRMRR